VSGGGEGVVGQRESAALPPLPCSAGLVALGVIVTIGWRRHWRGYRQLPPLTSVQPHAAGGSHEDSSVGSGSREDTAVADRDRVARGPTAGGRMGATASVGSVEPSVVSAAAAGAASAGDDGVEMVGVENAEVEVEGAGVRVRGGGGKRE